MKLLKLLWCYFMVSVYISKAKKYVNHPRVSNFYYGKARFYGNKN